MSKRPRRPERTARRARRQVARKQERADQRAARALVRDRERLAALQPGGAADHPIAVASSAIIEGRARALPCPQCGGVFRVDDHQAPTGDLRAVSVTCLQCTAKRQLWFRIAPPLLN